ncbi:DUF1822 family protein [Microcoleus sp. AT9b-C5]|uniref:DUF1822 family protein n=1 Tax=unclassified Microcoleus TaxID=2642155 RepID=UPI002FD53DBE
MSLIVDRFVPRFPPAATAGVMPRYASLLWCDLVEKAHIMEDYLTEWTIYQKTYNLALAYASEQADLEKGQRVFYNTLTVWAVNHLLGWMEFETILDKNESGNQVLQGILDVADLMLPGIGKIECSRISEEETAISLSVRDDALCARELRIAYIFVQLPDPLDKVKLLGFLPAADLHGDTVEISVADLQPFDNLSDYLERIELGTV